MQIHWTAELTTDLPVSDHDVATWLCRHRPELIRQLGRGSRPPRSVQVEHFMARSSHFANAVRVIYARAMHLVPSHAAPRVRRAA